MKKQQRKTYSTEFKVKVVLEAFKGQRTINELCSHYGVPPQSGEPVEEASRRKFARSFFCAARASTKKTRR